MDPWLPLAAQEVALVMTVHDLIPLTHARLLPRSRKARLRPLWKSWMRLQIARADAVVAVSRHTADEAGRLLGAPAPKVRVVHNPVRTWGAVEPPGHFRRRLGLDGRIVSCVGRADPYKNILGLVRALPALLRRVPDARLVIAGPSDPRYPEAGREAKRLGVAARVRFTGWLSDADLGALYGASEVFAFPSLAEGFGLPPLEAMRFGTPVVASRCGALPETLGDAALYADVEDPDALAGAIARALTDDALARRLGEAGRRRAELYTARRSAEEYGRLYQELVLTHNSVS
jgi:glycosyltransferase involved in cell wall biosynthesis